jgi:YD repeat-containing protein
MMSTATQTRPISHDVMDLAAGTAYSIKINNRSNIDNQNAIVFQEQPTAPRDVHSLAWLSKMCHAGTYTRFNWSLDVNFVSGQEGQLRPGVNFDAGQVISADLTGANQTTLSYIDDGFMFSKATQGRSQGSLFVLEDNTVPGYGNPRQGSVGIGMAGYGTFVTPTQPTGTGGLQFEVTPNYWIAFGQYVQGTVVSKSILTFPTAVVFPAGLFHAEASFDGLAWTIDYTATPQP